MDKRSVAFGFLRMAGRFYKWAFRNIFHLVRKSDEHIKAIEEKKRAAAQRNLSGSQPQHPL
ncbi:MAG TPA: hypothetical protein VEB42_08790 [Chitinophagaceae bacterium]|nr:hypothetical protein [Chitinophagaceae bacterium]